MYFLVVCPGLAGRASWIHWPQFRASKTQKFNIRNVIKDLQYLTQIILDSSVLADSGLIEMGEA